MGGGKSFKQTPTRLSLIRTDREITTYDTDIDHIAFDEEVENKSDDALNATDTDQFSITSIESDEELVESTKDLPEVNSRRSAAKDSEPANGFVINC